VRCPRSLTSNPALSVQASQEYLGAFKSVDISSKISSGTSRRAGSGQIQDCHQSKPTDRFPASKHSPAKRNKARVCISSCVIRCKCSLAGNWTRQKVQFAILPISQFNPVRFKACHPTCAVDDGLTLVLGVNQSDLEGHDLEAASGPDGALGPCSKCLPHGRCLQRGGGHGHGCTSRCHGFRNSRVAKKTKCARR
jgi:hypothetical protein